MSAKILETKNLIKVYGNYTALNKVSISVPKGSIYGLLGPNGAGKTSLMRIINQITAPDKGDVLFDGNKLKPVHARQIGYLPEERGLYKKMKVGEQALYLAQLKGMPYEKAIKKLKIWFDKFEITSWWNKKVEELSKGMAQKIQFIITILHEPKLLIFDEPFSGFDPINAALIRNEILKLKMKGTSIIFSTHRMESVEEICDYIALINNGTTVLEGKIDDIKDSFTDNDWEIVVCQGKIVENEFLKIKKNLHNNYTVQINKNVTQEIALNKILETAEIVSFKKKQLTMEEVFIKAVKK